MANTSWLCSSYYNYTQQSLFVREQTVLMILCSNAQRYKFSGREVTSQWFPCCKKATLSFLEQGVWFLSGWDLWVTIPPINCKDLQLQSDLHKVSGFNPCIRSVITQFLTWALKQSGHCTNPLYLCCKKKIFWEIWRGGQDPLTPPPKSATASQIKVRYYG